MKYTHNIAAILTGGMFFLGGCGSEQTEPAAESAPEHDHSVEADSHADAPAPAAVEEMAAEEPGAVEEVVEEVADSASEAGDVTLPSGVIIRDIVVGDGKEVQAGGTVEVHCVGTLTSGKEFWSSYSAAGGGKPFVSPLQSLIPAWQEGIPGMKVGGKRQLTCPPETAYGSAEKRNQDGSIAIPANSTLIFVIELIDVK